MPRRDIGEFHIRLVVPPEEGGEGRVTEYRIYDRNVDKQIKYKVRNHDCGEGINVQNQISVPLAA